MHTRVDRIRRTIGLFCISASGLMVIWGFTALKDRLSGFDYLVYWLICLVLVAVAILMALWDFWVMGIRDRRRKIERQLTESMQQAESNQRL